MSNTTSPNKFTTPLVAINKSKKFTWLFATVFILFFGLIGSFIVHKSHAAALTYYVSTTGSDTNAGTEAEPWLTIKRGITSLQPGDTLYVRGGTYNERIQNPIIQPGTATAGITVAAYPNERPVISGLLWLKGASYWTLDGINVTWGASNVASEHMTKMTDGIGWRITNAEIWGAHSFAGVLVAGAPGNWRIDHSIVHDTYMSNSTNQDHLIYVNTDASAGGGIIERNIFYNSANGRGVKIGPPSSTVNPIGAVTVRYNTFYNNTGPSNVQLSYGASYNKIYRNIFLKSGTGNSNVTDYNVNGTGNQVYENIGWDSKAVTDPSFADVTNLYRDPQFINAAGYDFHTQDTIAADYGRYAPGDEVTTPPTSADTNAPTTPTGLTASQVSGTSATLNWVESTDDTAVTRYDIYRDATKIASTQTPNYTDTSLKSLTSYSYTVTAADAAGNTSAASDAVAITTIDGDAPTTPTGVTASNITDSAATITWTASTDNLAVTGYELYRDGTEIASPTAESYTDSGLQSGSSYTYTIITIDAAGNKSTASSPLVVATLDTITPTTPTGLVATKITGTAVSVSWTASTDNKAVTGYEIYRGSTKVGTTSTTGYTDSALASATNYSYTVVAFDAAGNKSTASSPLVVKTLDTAAPTKPSSLRVVSTTSSSISLSWKASTDNVGVVGYNVYRNGSSTAIARVTGLTFVDTALKGRTSYTYTVRAVDAAGNLSSASSSVKGTTK